MIKCVHIEKHLQYNIECFIAQIAVLSCSSTFILLVEIILWYKLVRYLYIVPHNVFCFYSYTNVMKIFSFFPYLSSTLKLPGVKFMSILWLYECLMLKLLIICQSNIHTLSMSMISLWTFYSYFPQFPVLYKFLVC